VTQNNKPSGGTGSTKLEGTAELVLVYVTYPSLAQAEAAGRGAVEAKLAGCVNILPGMVSIYAWQGSIERAGEVVLLAKTRPDLAEKCADWLAAQHPYDVPAVLILPVVGGSENYLTWLRNETAG